MAADSRLGGPKRTRLVAAVRARRQPCPMCSYPIDQTLPRMGRRHPLSSVVDEWIPRQPCNGRCRRRTCTPVTPGTVDLTNCVETHSVCNGIKSNHWPITSDLRDQCRTAVEAIIHAPQPTIRPW